MNGEHMNGSARDLARRCKVLICEDHPQLREALNDVLSRDSRFEIIGNASDADTCLEQLPLTKPDVLILDVNMPGGGPDMAGAVKRLAPSTYVAVFSAREDAETRRAMLAAGADSYTVKTGRLRPLLDALGVAFETTSI
jgi:DNA-binding NarL/FixJ family response regulator